MKPLHYKWYFCKMFFKYINILPKKSYKNIPHEKTKERTPYSGLRILFLHLHFQDLMPMNFLFFSWHLYCLILCGSHFLNALWVTLYCYSNWVRLKIYSNELSFCFQFILNKPIWYFAQWCHYAYCIWH